MFRRKNKFVYTCPDVINYRKNQYRLVIWSNLFSLAYIAAFFGLLASLDKKTDLTLVDNTETPTE